MPTLSEIRTLSDEQLQVAKATVGPVLVTGGPGTGKTMSLIGRAAALLNGGVQAANIIVLTPSARRVEDLRMDLPENLRLLSPRIDHEQIKKVRTTTLEDLAIYILRRHGGEKIGMPATFGIRNDAQAKELAEELAARYGNQWRIIERDIPGILRWHWARSSKLHRSSENEAPRVPPCWMDFLDTYEAEKKSREVCDNRDLVPLAVRLMDQNSSYFEEWRKGTKIHLIVDDFQNLTPAEYRLLRLVSGLDGSITVAGDSNQCVGIHRGADGRHLKLFQQEFSRVMSIRLEASYGRNAHLTEMAARLAQGQNAPHIVGEISPFDPHEKQGNEQIRRTTLVEFTGDPSQMGGSIASEAKIWNQRGLAWEGMAVICRRHSYIDELKQIFSSREIPFTEMGDDRWRGVGEKQSGVALSTIHASQGRHWKNVWVVDVADHIMPGRTRSNDVLLLEEERHLFFVAVTRATQWLRLFYCSEEGTRAPTRLLESITDQLDRRQIRADPAELAARFSQMMQGTRGAD